MSTDVFFFSLAVVPVPQMYGLPLVCLQFLREPWETMKSIKRLQKVSLKYMYREERREKKKMMLEGKREGREWMGMRMREWDLEAERQSLLFTLFLPFLSNVAGDPIGAAADVCQFSAWSKKWSPPPQFSRCRGGNWGSPSTSSPSHIQPKISSQWKASIVQWLTHSYCKTNEEIQTWGLSVCETTRKGKLWKGIECYVIWSCSTILS